MKSLLNDDDRLQSALATFVGAANTRVCIYATSLCKVSSGGGGGGGGGGGNHNPVV